VYEQNKGSSWISTILNAIDRFINSIKKMWDYLKNVFTCITFLLNVIIDIVGA